MLIFLKWRVGNRTPVWCHHHARLYGGKRPSPCFGFGNIDAQPRDDAGLRLGIRAGAVVTLDVLKGFVRRFGWVFNHPESGLWWESRWQYRSLWDIAVYLEFRGGKGVAIRCWRTTTVLQLYPFGGPDG